jgi:hypothetical protein
MNNVSANEKEQKRKAVGVFPRLSLTKSLELINAIYELGEGEDVRRRTVFDKLGKSPDSGPSRVIIIACNSGYGLSTGGYQAEYLGLTELGKQIASAKDTYSKFEGIYNALFSNEIFSAFITRFNDKSIPIDEIAIEYLRKNHDLPEEDAQACWAVFKDNLLEQNLTQELSGKKVIISREAALAIIGKPIIKKVDESPKDSVDNSDMTAEQSHTQHTSKPKKHSEVTAPQIHFNIQVVIPENASPETYDTIFKSIATHLLNRDNE